MKFCQGCVVLPSTAEWIAKSQYINRPYTNATSVCVTDLCRVHWANERLLRAARPILYAQLPFWVEAVHPIRFNVTKTNNSVPFIVFTVKTCQYTNKNGHTLNAFRFSLDYFNYAAVILIVIWLLSIWISYLQNNRNFQRQRYGDIEHYSSSAFLCVPESLAYWHVIFQLRPFTCNISI